MPSKAPSACRKCKKATRNHHGYCDDHAQLAVGWQRSHGGKTAAQRGYGHAWRKLREQVLARDKGLCQVCKKQGIYQTAGEVDHLISKAAGGTNSPSNLQAICTACHKRKTAIDAKTKR